jgi:hypothetical protein
MGNYETSKCKCPVCDTLMEEEVNVYRELLDMEQEEIISEEAVFLKCPSCFTELTIANNRYPIKKKVI